MAKLSAKYEILYIIDPAQGEEGIAALVEKFKSLAEGYGEVTSVDEPMGPHLPDRQRYHSRRNSGKREKAALINGYENRIPIPAESSSILHP